MKDKRIQSHRSGAACRTASATARLLLGVAALALPLGACRQAPETTRMTGDTLATVGRRPITLRAFNDYLARHGLASGTRETALAEMVGQEAAVIKARAAGYAQHEDLLAQFERLLAERFKEDQLAHSPAALPGEPEIRAYYETNAARFTQPELVRAALIHLSLSPKATTGNAAAVHARAEQLRAEAAAGNAEAFGRLALRNSDDQATRYRAGDLGFLTADQLKQRVGLPVAQALEQLRGPGQISPVLDGPGGVYLVKFIARQPGRRRPLSEVSDGIAYLLRRDKQAEAEREFYRCCTNGLVVRINRALLDGLAPQPEPATPPSLPALQTASAK